MVKDPIIEEIHKTREQLAKDSNYDLHTLVEKMRKREKESKAKIVSRIKNKNNTPSL